MSYTNSDRFFALPLMFANLKITIRKLFAVAAIIFSINVHTLQAQYIEVNSSELILKDYDNAVPSTTYRLIGDADGFGGASGFTDASVIDYVKVYFDQGMTTHISASMAINVIIEIKKYPIAGATVTETCTLKVSFSHDNLNIYDDQAIYTFSDPGYYKIKATITGITDGSWAPITPSSLPANLKMVAGIRMERYFDFSPAVAPTTTKLQYLDDIKAFRVKDFNVAGALYYDLEWTFIDDFKTGGLAGSLTESEIQFSFKNNATRIRVSPGTKVYIPAVFDRGYLIVRARGVGPSASDVSKILEGKWSIEDPYDNGAGLFEKMNLTGVSSNYYQKVQASGGATIPHPHMKDMTWMIQTTYSEEGKMKFVVSYADATGRIHQTASMSNTEKEAIITQAIYDFQGRSVLQSLPTPAPLVATPIDGYRSALTYYADINQTTTGVIYDKSMMSYDEASCVNTIPAFGTGNGAGQYYSEANLKKTDFHSFIPNANGYPFTFVKYRPDNTGRLSAQTSAGLNHKIGSGHEISYLYGTPDQPELDRLFGGNVGLASHYFKMAVIDPNGQVSVSYTDIDGHVIATALAGPSPDNLDELKNGELTAYEDSQEEMMVDILGISDDEPHGVFNDFSLDGDTYEAKDVFIVPTETNYHFVYTAQGAHFVAECLAGRCFECVYDLEIQLTDACGNQYLNTGDGSAFKFTLGTMPSIGDIPAETCDDETYNSVTTDDMIFTVLLPQGEYTLTKTLVLNEEAMNIHAENYIDALEASNPECFETLSEALTSAANLTFDCELDCSYCNSITDFESFLETEFASSEEYPETGTPEYEFYLGVFEEIKTECDDICNIDPFDPCYAGLQGMLTDVSPGGQYGEYVNSATGEVDAAEYPLSIYNEDNILQLRSVLTGDAVTSYYKHPKFYDAVSSTWLDGIYLDGERVKVDLTSYVDLAIPLATVTDSYFEEDLNLDGILEKVSYPENLKLSYFIENYELDWAYSLICYHPEYYYYQDCILAYECGVGVTIPGDAAPTTLNTYQFDEVLYTTPYADIVALPDLVELNWRLPYLNDPLFNEGGCTALDADVDVFIEDYLENFQHCSSGETIDIYEAVYNSLNGIPGILDECEAIEQLAGTFSSHHSSITSEDAWLLFVNFYRSAKLKYLNSLAHKYAQGDIGAYDPGEPDRFGLNLSIDNDEYYWALSYTLVGMGIADFWWELALNENYQPFIIRSVFLQNKAIRFPDISWHNGIPPYIAMDDPLFEEMVAEAGASVDAMYYASTGNKPLAMDWEIFLNSVIDHASATATNWRTTDYDVLDIPGISERIYTELDSRCLLTWDVVIGTTAYANDKLTWTNTTAGCTVVTSCTDNYLTISPSVSPEPNYTWNDDIIGFHDIQIIDEALGTYTIQIDFDIAGVTKTATANGKTCIPMNQNTFDQTSCDLAPEGNTIWAFLNYLIANPSISINTATDQEVDPIYIDGSLDAFVGEDEGPYYWKKIATGEYELHNADNSKAIRVSLETLAGAPVNFTTDTDEDELITVFEPDPDLGGGGYPVTVGYIDMFTLTQENPGGTPLNVKGTVKYRNTPPAGGTYYLHSYPVSECGQITILSEPCDEPENFSSIYLNQLLAELLGGPETFTTGEHISLEVPDTYPGWTTHLSMMVGGSDIEEEVLYVQSYSPTAMTLIFQTHIGATYTDLCTVTLEIPDADPALTLEEISADVLLVAHEELAVGGVTHDFTLECSELGTCSDEDLATVVWGHIDCLGLKNCPCPDKSTNGSFYNSVETSIIQNGGGINSVDIGGIHPITGVSDATTIAVSAGKPVIVEIQSYLKTEKVLLTPDLVVKIQAHAFGNGNLIDTVYADNTGDTSLVFVKLDGYEATGMTGITATTDCNPTYTSFPVLPYIDPCIADQMDLALNNAYAEYNEQVDSMMLDFKSKYKEKCMENLGETLTKTFTSAEYHYTLYYYDQAGNLTMTVPPIGVDLLNATELEEMAAYRESPATETAVFPTHLYKSEYRYNSLNQLSMQKTPDANESRFWYDALGRIVLSQNAVQAQASGGLWKFSYTLYDNLGRIYEVGEVTKTVTSSEVADIEEAIFSEAIFATFISSGTRKQVTSTYYTDALITVDSPFGADGQKNLRNRVSAVTIEESGDTDILTYDNASHYSYDIHGNVNVLIQDNKELGDSYSSQRYKRMDYNYDLVSGNVLQVAYQDNKADQFYHKYKYDADNRIYEVHTSRDGWIWEKDARYFYYRHGPLARTETGDLIVQGTDYAYTIQGWLKGVNSGALIADRDMGKDGYNDAANSHKLIAQDVYGFALYYFDDDYAQINTGGSAKFLPNLSSSNFTGAGSSLYNGNIMAMSTALLKPLETGDADGKHDKTTVLGKIYTYDQLNRISASDSYEKTMTDVASFTWGGGASGATNKWATTYKYDGNGNILKMKRAGSSGTAYDMDNLTYHYNSTNNQLQYVDDAIVDGAYGAEIDIDDQASDNYIYDAIGNLTSDVKGDIGSIAWTVYGKIKTIIKPTANKKIEFEYDAMGNRTTKKVGPNTGSGIITWTYYVRDASGNIMATYTRLQDGDSTSIKLTEQHIYGSNRLGYVQTNINVLATFSEDTYFYRTLGEKRYEFTNHLGNVLSVISDRRLSIQNGGTGITLYYEADVIAYQDYDPFGMILEGRNKALSGENYRFGFNGYENTDEILGENNAIDFGGRVCDSRLGRFFSIDPYASQYPNLSPYIFAANSPILLKDNYGNNPLIAAIIKGMLGATIDAGIQFAVNLAVNGGNAQEAFNEIDWEQALWSGAQCMLPWNSPTSKYGRAAVEAAEDIAINYARGKYNGLSGNDLLAQIVEDFFVGAGTSYLTSAAADKVKAWLALRKSTRQKPAVHVPSKTEVIAKTTEEKAVVHTKTTSKSTAKTSNSTTPSTNSSKLDHQKLEQTPGVTHQEGTWSVYSLGNKHIGNGNTTQVYFGMSKNGVDGRYSATFKSTNGEAKNLITGIPDRETALGIEYIIYDINGGKNNLANKINPTNNEDYIKKGRDWLDANVPRWSEIIDFTPSSVD